MRRAFIVVAFALLVACSPSNIQKAQDAAAAVKKNCGVIVSVADIAAAFSAANPVVTTVAAMAHAICAQAQAEKENSGIIFRHYAQSVPVHHEGISAQEWLQRIAQVEQPEPAPLPQPDPPEAPAEEGTGIVPEPVEPPVTPAPAPEPEDDCVAVVNGVCIHKEEVK